MGQLLNTSSVIMCPHGGTVTAVTSNTKAKAAGSFILRSSDTFTIAGCSFNISGTPHPCVQVQWTKAAQKSQASGDFVLTTDSIGLCIAADQATQGTALINFTQSQVQGI